MAIQVKTCANCGQAYKLKGVFSTHARWFCSAPVCQRAYVRALNQAFRDAE